MDTTSDHKGSSSRSELDKFKLFYEVSTPTHKVRAEIRRHIK